MNALIAALAGAALPFSLAPFHHWWLGIAAMAGLAIALRQASPGRGFLLAWLFGSVSFGFGVSWIYVAMHVYGGTSAWLSTIMTGAFCITLGLIPGLFGYLYCRWIRGGRAGSVLGFAALWVLTEWFRGWFLTGFPWLYLGYAHLDTALSGWAPVTGVLGLSFWVALAGAALAELVWPSHSRRQRALPAVAVLALALLGYSLGQLSWTSPSPSPKGTLQVGAVQPNIAQDKKWAYTEYWDTLDKLDKASAPLWPEVDLVIWPEAAVPALYHQAAPFFDYIREQAEAHNTALITGVPTRDGEAMYNSTLVVTGGEGAYHKQRLGPFGEYVPLASLIRGLIRFFDLPMSSFSRGADHQPPLQAGGWAFASAICYEIVYPDLVAEGAAQADVLFTVSNDAWFGDTKGPHQHMQMAQMRALENGRELLRVTNTGITAFVDHRGQIRQRLPAFEPGVMQGEVHARQGLTPFARWRSLPIVLLCAAIVIIAALSHRRR